MLSSTLALGSAVGATAKLVGYIANQRQATHQRIAAQECASCKTLAAQSYVHVCARVYVYMRAVAVLALCALYKLAPLHHPGAAAARAAVAADLPLAAALPFGALPCDAGADPLAAPAPAVRHPRADAVPPDLVDLLVTNAGVHAPSYAPRLLAEMYAPEDHDLLRAEL